MKVTKKPVTVDAWRVSDLLDTHIGDLPPEVLAAHKEGIVDFESDRITIATIEGTMTGWSNWWLIMGIKGEFYPCDDEVFRGSYNIAEEPTVRGTVLGTAYPGATGPLGPAIGLPPSPSAFAANPEGDR